MYKYTRKQFLNDLLQNQLNNYTLKQLEEPSHISSPTLFTIFSISFHNYPIQTFKPAVHSQYALSLTVCINIAEIKPKLSPFPQEPHLSTMKPDCGQSDVPSRNQKKLRETKINNHPMFNDFDTVKNYSLSATIEIYDYHPFASVTNFTRIRIRSLLRIFYYLYDFRILLLM